jgi:hypothetical protein
MVSPLLYYGHCWRFPSPELSIIEVLTMRNDEKRTSKDEGSGRIEGAPKVETNASRTLPQISIMLADTNRGRQSFSTNRSGWET